MTDDLDPLPVLRALIAIRYGTQAEAARQWGLSRSFVSEVMHGKKGPTADILDAAGLERVVFYRWKHNTESRTADTLKRVIAYRWKTN